MLFVMEDEKGSSRASILQIGHSSTSYAERYISDSWISGDSRKRSVDMSMNTIVGFGSFGVVCLLAVMSVGVGPASAVSRVSGDFYTYSMSMDLSGVDASGTVTYSFEGLGTISVNGQAYDVNIMKVSGAVTGSVGFLGFSASAALGGHVYETRDGMAVVKDDAFMWTNISLGTGSFQLVTRSELEILSTYSPPLMKGFTPSHTAPGDSWSETVSTTTTSTMWLNGTMQGSPSTDTEQITFSFVAASSMESVTTPAGTFDTIRITATDDSGGSSVFWWSSDVANFVKQQDFSEGSSQPDVSMTLTDYNRGASPSAILFIGIGLVVALFAVIVLVVVLLMRRRPGQPIPYQPGMPVPQPYAPPLPGPPSPGSETVLRTPQDFARRTR